MRVTGEFHENQFQFHEILLGLGAISFKKKFWEELICLLPIHKSFI
jgi:hypothetical protein